MANYTYGQFNAALKQSGLGGSFSQADLSLAKRNPNAGMSLLNYKRDYAAATTDEARKRANAGAENIRSTYGGYTGGTDGSSYYLSNPTPSSFNYATAAPTFDYNKQSPTWKDAYKNAYNSALDAITNYKDFSYDPATDPLYGSYSKVYTREGRRATQDTLGEVSAQTGGMPSSYAVNAAAQAGNYYAAQMADKIPELQQQAYDQYLNDFSIRQAQLTAAGSARDSDYLRYLDEWTQYNTDRNFAYGQYQDKLAQYNNDRDFAYGQHIDQINYNAQQRAEQQALAELLYGETGNASGYADFVTPEQLAALNTAGAANQHALQTSRDYDAAVLEQLLMQNDRLPTEYAQQDAAYTRDAADWKAGYGDYSGLSALGVDTSQLMTERNYNNALMAAELDAMVNPSYYGGSGGSYGGAGTSEQTWLVDEMLATGSDEYAREILARTGYAQGIQESLWEQYENKKKGVVNYSAPTWNPGSFSDRDTAISYMVQLGVPTAQARGAMSESEWNALRQQYRNGNIKGDAVYYVAPYTNYSEYLTDFVENAMKHYG